MPLYLCPTPLGNLEDITLRTLRILRESDFIAAENTLHTRKLLNHFDIRKKLISYYDTGNPAARESKEKQLLEILRNGKSAALVSSAGTPLISDPGYELVRKCLLSKIPVIALPGPSAVITALAGSGLAPHPFYFGGFLPSKAAARQAALKKVAGIEATLVYYEAPHRIRETLKDCLEILGDRQAALARELSKIHEEFIRGKLSKLRIQLEEAAPKGELTLAVEGKSSEEAGKVIGDEILEEEIQALLKRGTNLSEASRQVAKNHGLSKNKVYRLAHRLFR